MKCVLVGAGSSMAPPPYKAEDTQRKEALRLHDEDSAVYEPDR